MAHFFRDDLQLLSHKIKTVTHSPFLTALRRLQERNTRLPRVRFNERRRFVVFGASEVGKTAIIRQFLYDEFDTKYIETIEDFHTAEFNLSNGASLTLDIIDTAGSLEFPAMRKLSISTGHSFILVYSVDNQISFEEVKRIRKEIVERRGPAAPIVVVANKTDEENIERVVRREMVDEEIKLWNCAYLECNVKQNAHIVEIFTEALAQANVSYDLHEAIRQKRNSHQMYISTHERFKAGLDKLLDATKRISCNKLST